MPALAFFQALGEVMLLTASTARELLRPPWEIRLWVVQVEQGGVQSWSITVLTAIFTGMVMASQFAIGLEPFGASVYTGKLVSLGIVRELGPVLTAEMGSMAVTEQIDAIRALGANPVRKLVVPRVVAMVLALPLLTILADLVGCFGGLIITMHEVGITFRFGLEQMIDTVDVPDLVHGILKSAFFGYFIAIIGCWVGMKTRGGTEGVGQATTRTVVWTSITILVSDFFLTRFFLAIYG